MELFVDTETYSELDIKNVGTINYARNAELMLIGYAIDDEPVKVIDLTFNPALPLAEEFRSIIIQADICVAHHVLFDKTVLNLFLNLPKNLNWQDNMAKALTLGLPASLDKLGQALELGADEVKIKDGKRLINKFCKPAPKNHKVDRYTRWNAPEDWAKLIEYARQDVETMRTCWRKTPDWNYR